MDLRKVLARSRSPLPKHQELTSPGVVRDDDAGDDAGLWGHTNPAGYLDLLTYRCAGPSVAEARIDAGFGAHRLAAPDRQVAITRRGHGKQHRVRTNRVRRWTARAIGRQRLGDYVPRSSPPATPATDHHDGADRGQDGR